MRHVAINAVSLAPGGGLTGLLGYLQAWQEIDAPLAFTLFASRPAVLEAVIALRPDVRVVRFGVGLNLVRRRIREHLSLGRAMAASGAAIALTTNYAVAACPLPQVVHHRNLLLFEPASMRAQLGQGWKRALQARAARRSLQRSTANIYISDYLRRAAERLVPASAPRNHVIHNGLPSATIESASRPPSPPEDGLLVCITADLPHKDTASAVKTLAALISAYPERPWKLRVIGEGRFEEEKRLARQLRVDERIAWDGFLPRTDIDGMFQRAFCLLYTSRVEGFGNPPLEAMARGCPVIAWRTTAIPEVVGDAGILVDPEERQDLASGVSALLDPAARDARSERGRRHVESFRWTDSARRFASLLLAGDSGD